MHGQAQGYRHPDGARRAKEMFPTGSAWVGLAWLRECETLAKGPHRLVP